MIAGFIMLSFSCEKKIACPKEGYVFTNTTSTSWYNPVKDSFSLGDSILLIASLPRTFIDEATNVTVHNTSFIAEGPLHVVMLYPIIQPAVENFTIAAETGRVIKDTIHLSESLLKGVRTIQWNGNSSDSFRIKIIIKPEVKGVYSFNLGQQSSKDADCALYKYFIKVGHAQHLYYLAQYNNGYIGNYERNYSYCFKVY